mmetsp:Transcript_1086/g.4127  ORF Transcript_1086/g.4127 Transcript_1086/m.4127 type:complete len:207 (+) Transcript_1086:825-1445(+)
MRDGSARLQRRRRRRVLGLRLGVHSSPRGGVGRRAEHRRERGRPERARSGSQSPTADAAAGGGQPAAPARHRPARAVARGGRLGGVARVQALQVHGAARLRHAPHEVGDVLDLGVVDPGENLGARPLSLRGDQLAQLHLGHGHEVTDDPPLRGVQPDLLHGGGLRVLSPELPHHLGELLKVQGSGVVGVEAGELGAHVILANLGQG